MDKEIQLQLMKDHQKILTSNVVQFEAWLPQALKLIEQTFGKDSTESKKFREDYGFYVIATKFGFKTSTEKDKHRLRNFNEFSQQFSSCILHLEKELKESKKVEAETKQEHARSNESHINWNVPAGLPQPKQTFIQKLKRSLQSITFQVWSFIIGLLISLLLFVIPFVYQLGQESKERNYDTEKFYLKQKVDSLSSELHLSKDSVKYFKNKFDSSRKLILAL